MGMELPGVLMFFLAIFKISGSAEAWLVWGTPEADCSSSCSSTSCDCTDQGLTSVPQDLPRTITALDLGENQITNISQSDFSRYRNLRTLRLSSNRISTLNNQTFYFLSNLTTLWLDGNQIKTLKADIFTGLGNLQGVNLIGNYINDIQAGTFSSTPQLQALLMYSNKLTNLRSDMFTGLRNLHTLELYNNEISDIQAGTFSSTPQLRSLYLHNNNITTFPFNDLTTLSHLYLFHNQLTTLSSATYDILSSISYVYIVNNPWQCDCNMAPFMLKMRGSRSFETQITCSQPFYLHGRQLLDIKPRNLISDCEEPTIRFHEIQNSPLVQGDTLHLVCEASGIPTPDITVILPSGQNATVESVGRVTVDVNGTITITNIISTDAGLYVCVAANFVGSTFATLLVDIQNDMHTTTNMVATSSTLAFNETSYRPEINCHEPTTTLSLPVLLGAIFGSVAGTLIIVAIILTIGWRRNTKSLLKGPEFSVVFNNTNTTTTVITNGHPQTMSESSNVTNSQQVPRPASSQFEPYEDVVPPPSNPRTRGAVPRQTATRQVLRPHNRNNGEPPPVPPPRTASAAHENVPEDNHESTHHYQSLRKPENSSSSAGDSQHHYQSLQRPQQPH